MKVLGNAGALNATVGEVVGTDVDMVVGGTFVGTITLQTFCEQAGAWVAVATGLTAVGIQTVRCAQERRFRAQATAYTSGTANVDLQSATNREARVTL